MLNKFIELRKANSEESAIAQAEDLKSTEYQLKVGENMRIIALTKFE